MHETNEIKKKGLRDGKQERWGIFLRRFARFHDCNGNFFVSICHDTALNFVNISLISMSERVSSFSSSSLSSTGVHVESSLPASLKDSKEIPKL